VYFDLINYHRWGGGLGENVLQNPNTNSLRTNFEICTSKAKHLVLKPNQFERTRIL
jgi:hypothetical protein